MSTVAERVEREAAAADGKRCEVVIRFIGVDWPCGEPAVGLFRRVCVHEHIRDGWLCQDHVDGTERGFCRTCNDLSDGMAHECPIVLTPLEEVAT